MSPGAQSFPPVRKQVSESIQLNPGSGFGIANIDGGCYQSKIRAVPPGIDRYKVNSGERDPNRWIKDNSLIEHTIKNADQVFRAGDEWLHIFPKYDAVRRKQARLSAILSGIAN
jgi:hypothetical protein